MRCDATPRAGELVLYTLSQDDAVYVNARRVAPADVQDQVLEARWPVGAQAHVGTTARDGMVQPALVVGVHADGTVNLQVFLDGTDVLWARGKRAASAESGAHPGRWHRNDDIHKISTES